MPIFPSSVQTGMVCKKVPEILLGKIWRMLLTILLEDSQAPQGEYSEKSLPNNFDCLEGCAKKMHNHQEIDLQEFCGVAGSGKDHDSISVRNSCMLSYATFSQLPRKMIPLAINYVIFVPLRNHFLEGDGKGVLGNPAAKSVGASGSPSCEDSVLPDKWPSCIMTPGRRKYGNEIPWQCSWRSSGALSAFCLETPHFMRGSFTLF